MFYFEITCAPRASPNDHETRFVQHFSSENLGIVSGVNISSLSTTSDSLWQLNAWKHCGPNSILLTVTNHSSDCGRSSFRKAARP